ncbi:hypothetical protein [Limosilactobacillus caecicola]|uniref:hypothetical protein n=1 Tax=Limosilactobacillus caecicola TaxID=2941332 RepID=UPI00203BB83D|nr:hypothetical protein [Limosilactobacillus caecicola]
MGELLFLIIVIAIIWVFIKYIHKPEYRVSMTDPVTGHVKYLMSVDGINNSFNYTSDPNSALRGNDAATLERYMKTLPADVHAKLEMHNFIGWQNMTDKL